MDVKILLSHAMTSLVVPKIAVNLQKDVFTQLLIVMIKTNAPLIGVHQLEAALMLQLSVMIITCVLQTHVKRILVVFTPQYLMTIKTNVPLTLVVLKMVFNT
jgi:hypothetical protein